MITGWILCFARGVFGPGLVTRPIESVVLIGLETMLFTGLFITAHDAIHGSVCPSNQKLNDRLGKVAVGLYALFPFSRLKTEHYRHHQKPATPSDPDFHGRRSEFWSWYWHFVKHYVSLSQFALIVAVAQIPIHGFGVSPLNVYAFWVLPSVLSTFQLFYFGTYLPHREVGGYPDKHRARSLPFSRILSFFTCYHFSGYHHEHHLYPHVPWWKLPEMRL